MRICRRCRHVGFGWWAIAAAVLVAACPSDAPVPSSSPVPGSSPPDPSAATAEPRDDGRIEIPLDSEYASDEASLARNFYFIFDGSGSMREETGRGCQGDQRFEDKLAGAQWAVREFLGKVPEEINIGLYVFDDKGRDERLALGRDNRGEFLAALDAIRAGGGTPLARSIRFGTDQLIEQYKRQLGYGEFRLVVVTDGKADDIPEAALYATRYGVPIYAIGLCIGESHPLRRHAVSYRAADNFADLARGLEETLAELPAFDLTEFE